MKTNHFLPMYKMAFFLLLPFHSFTHNFTGHFIAVMPSRILWICSDVWMDILPSFDHSQLGLKMALLSDRFDVLVDAYFGGKSELTIWRGLTIRKDFGPKAKLSKWIDGNSVDFPLPDHSLPIKIRFKKLGIQYIDHSVIKFLRSNKPIWDRSGIKLKLFVYALNVNQSIWDVFVHEILPIFASTIRHLGFDGGYHLDSLRRRTSPTFLTDLDQLNSIDSGVLLPEGIADDGPNATSAGQALAKWLHTPSRNGQQKQLHRNGYLGTLNFEWVNNFKETFRRATTSVSYNTTTMPTEEFELVNEVTNEKLTLKQKSEEYHLVNWLLQRCPIGETAKAPVKWKNRENSDANFNYIRFDLRRGNHSGANLNSVRFGLAGKHCIGPVSPPAAVEEEEAD